MGWDGMGWDGMGWDGIGPVGQSRASDGRGFRGKVEAVEYCRSRLIVHGERGERGAKMP